MLAFYALVLSVSLWLQEATFLSSNYEGTKPGMDPGKWLGHPRAFDTCRNVSRSSSLLAGRESEGAALGSCLYRSINYGLRRGESEIFKLNTRILSHLVACRGSVAAAPCGCSRRGCLFLRCCNSWCHKTGAKSETGERS